MDTKDFVTRIHGSFASVKEGDTVRIVSVRGPALKVINERGEVFKEDYDASCFRMATPEEIFGFTGVPVEHDALVFN